MKPSPARRSSRQRRLSSILDRELGDRSKDAFGHRHFAKALEDLIETEARTPPFSIGLLGSWGTGKSTIKELYLQELKSSKSPRGRNSRGERIFPITFNAWRHGGEEDLKRALLRTVFLSLGGNENKLDEELFQQINVTASVRRPVWDWFAETFAQIFCSGMAIVLLFAAIFGLVWGGFYALDQLTEWPLAVGALGALGLTAYLATHLLKLRLQAPALFQPRTSISFPSRTAEEYEKLLLGQLVEFLKGPRKSVERLVIFVDDLDRLSAAEMVRGLDAIRNFLELPLGQLKQPIGVVFVISCDEDRVAEALHSKLYHIGAEVLPGTVFTKADARRYLDRLFQFRLEIPLFPKQDMRAFARDKLEELDGEVKALEEKGVLVETVIDTLIHVGVQSPRNAIQLLNAFLHSWWIAVERETDGQGSKSTGALYVGAVTKHPVMLAALTVLKVDFPDFYDSIQARPELLEEFRQVLFGGVEPSTLPLAATESMQPFLQIDKEGKYTSSVRREHRTLRQYLASIEGLRRPASLQPLLCLAVDPISRNFGDGAQDIFNALVSGDVQGLLETLGRALDTEPLAETQAALLRELVERAMEDTELRRTNTARVLAELAPRIRGNARRHLLTSLVRQMVALKEVRRQVGPASASDVIADVTDTDQREVAGEFINDLMNKGVVDWKKGGGSAPNIDELSEVVRAAVTLGVTVWRDCGLDARHKQILRTWLLDRTIESAEGSTQLPFSYLNALVRENTTTLLPELNPDYVEQAIEVLQSETETISDPAGTFARLESEFTRLAVLGQEERSVLWQLLTRLISVKGRDATALAWRAAGVHKDLATPTQAMEFLAAFSARLQKDLSEGGDWPVEWPVGGDQFVDLLNNWREHLTQASAGPLLPIMTNWAGVEACEELSIKCLDILRDRSEPAWTEAIETILAGGLGEMREKTGRYLGSMLGDMSEANAATFKGHLDSVINSDAPEAGLAATYRAVLAAAPPASWETQPWSDHLQTAVNRFGRMHSTPDFVEQILPAIAALIPYMAEGSAAGFISSLFANAAGQPDAYIKAHQAFHGGWPKTSDHIGDYQPDQIVSRACQFIRENAVNPGIGAVFLSLTELAEQDLITADTYNQIGSIVPLVWRTAPDALIAKDMFVATVTKPEVAAQLALGVQPPSVDGAALASLLEVISDTFDDQTRLMTAQAILDAQPVALVEEPDGALASWFTAMGKNKHAVTVTFLLQKNLNDDQQLRVAMLLSPGFWVPENIELLASMLADASNPKTQAHILSNLPAIASASENGSDRTELATQLSGTLPSLNAEQIQAVAKEINNLGGRPMLERRKDILQNLDDNQVDALLHVFPASRVIRKRRDALDQDQSSQST